MRYELPRGGCAGLLGALADRHGGFLPAFGGVPRGRGCPRFVGRGSGLRGLPRHILLTELLGVSTDLSFPHSLWGIEVGEGEYYRPANIDVRVEVDPSPEVVLNVADDCASHSPQE